MNVEAVSLAFAAVFTPYNMLVVAGVTALVLLLAGIVGLALIGRGRP